MIVRDAVRTYPVFPFLALRFLLATALLAPSLLRRGPGLQAGLLPGAVLALSYVSQTEGLRYTTASKAGLLTGLFVVFTPVFAFVVYRRPPSRVTTVAVGIALAGTALLASGGGHARSELLGDALEVLTAALLATHILLLARIKPTQDATRVALSQMGVCALLFTLGSANGSFRWPDAEVWLVVLITGTLASALAFWIQTLVQQRIAPTRAAVILVGEPAFAMFFGFALAGDRFNAAQAVGAGLIFLALASHEVAPFAGAS